SRVRDDRAFVARPIHRTTVVGVRVGNDIAEVVCTEPPHEAALAQDAGRPIQVARLAIVIGTDADVRRRADDSDAALHCQNPCNAPARNMPRGISGARATIEAPRTATVSPADTGGATWTASNVTSADW